MSCLCEKCGAKKCYRVKEPGEVIVKCGAFKSIVEENSGPEYIERKAAIEAIVSEPPDAHYPSWCAYKIRSIPASDVAPVRHGRWLEVREIEVREKRLFGEHYFLCSNCKSRNGLMIHFNYCPNCGSKMDGDG